MMRGKGAVPWMHKNASAAALAVVQPTLLKIAERTSGGATRLLWSSSFVTA